MDFSHYTDAPVQLAVDLVNTDQRSFDGTDSIGDLEGLKDFLSSYAHLWEAETRPPEKGDVERVRDLRDRLRRVFEAGDPTEAAREVNALLSENVAGPRLSVHDGAPPHLHFEPLDSTLSQWLAVVTAMGLATVIADHGVERFGTCAAEACSDVYIDTSRNRSRRHCSTTCSTRENVAAYRRRQRISHR